MDFDQTFKVVIKPIIFQVLFAISTYFNLNIEQIDIKIAFLYSLIDELIYIKMPKRTKIEITKNMVYKLFKALYSLKQLPHL